MKKIGLVFVAIMMGTSDASFADVKFLAIGHPSAIRIQGNGKVLNAEKVEWKTGKFSGVFHVPLDSLETGIGLRDRHMKEKYLETGKYPNADLAVEGCPLKVGAESCEAKLTLHGVSKPVTLALTVTDGEPKSFAVDAAFTIKLSDFGIEIPKFANITVAEDVKVEVATETPKP